MGFNILFDLLNGCRLISECNFIRIDTLAFRITFDCFKFIGMHGAFHNLPYDKVF